MPNLFNRIEAIWDNLKAGEAKTRAHFAIKRDHIDNGYQHGPRFQPGQHYFQIIVNEMFLANQREWFVKYDPMAFAASSYIYNKQLETVPMVVGPSILSQFRQQVPKGMIFQNTPVSQLHPYQGGSLTLVIILNKLERENNADKLLQVVESVSNAVDPAKAFSVYLTIAKTVLDGVETLLGLEQTVPVVGYRIPINPQIGQVLEPTYFVLIDADARQIQQNRFWVRNDSLYYVNDQGKDEHYSDHDFILFSIAQGDRRNDERILPFYPLWETTKDLAARPIADGDHFWKEAKAQFNTLKRELLNSPDLTAPDSKRLREQYFTELSGIREETIREGKLAPQPLSDAETELRRMADELDKLD